MLTNIVTDYVHRLRGGGAVPKSRKEALAFQALFALTMACVMVLSVNLLLLAHDVPTTAAMLPSVPFWFAFAFGLRELYANKLSFFVKGRFIDKHFQGFLGQVAFVFTNVVLMAPVLCAVGVGFGIWLAGLPVAEFPAMYLHMLPRAAALAFCLVLFVVKPLVSLVFGKAVARRSRLASR